PRRWRIIATGLKTVGFVGTVLITPLAWSVLFLLFFIPALIAFGLRTVRGQLSWNGKHRWKAQPLLAHDGDEAPAGAIIFDRRRDVSKLLGCNTRNVQFRWDIFSRWIATLLQHRAEPTALDLGAGSLRDTYELTTLGVKVDALDLNAEQ